LLSPAPVPEFTLGELKLAPSVTALLEERGEVRLERAQIPQDRRLLCFHCRHSWTLDAAQSALPAHCPRCGKRRWNVFRLFHCRFCSHEFAAGDLLAWPYWIFPDCPACHRTHWHVGCEDNPLRWLLNPFNRLPG
jgi:Zn finger protein HypA/HybF involved in hydrogenase expression